MKRRSEKNSHSKIFGAGLEPYTGPWTRAEVWHLVRRTLFCGTKSDVNFLASKTMSDAVDALFAFNPPPPDPVAYLSSGSVAAGSTWINDQNSGTDTQRTVMLATWWFDLMLNQHTSITEKLTLFWHNHFATSYVSVKDPRYMYKQNALIRDYAVGNFKDLVRQITFDAAMLRFLNGATNTKAHANENYGRELQELFTIGKGPEIAPGDYTNYTEADIKAAARVLTGWSDVASTVTAKFAPSDHDTGDKQFSSNYGNKVIRGGKDESGARREIDELLNMIFSQDALAERMMRKLYIWFVDYNIDDDIRDNILKPLAAQFRSSGFEIKPVLTTLLKSTHFYEASMRGCMIKSPVDFTIGTLRNFRVSDFFESKLNEQFYGGRTLRRYLATIQQEPLNPPNVAGWPAYYQAPDYHELWINSDTLQKRVKFISDLTTDGMAIDEQQYDKGYFDVIEAAKRCDNPSSADGLIREWAEWCFPLQMPDEAIAQFKNSLLGGLPDYEWTVEWNSFIADEKNETNKNAIVTKLRLLLKNMMNMAEFQLM